MPYTSKNLTYRAYCTPCRCTRLMQNPIPPWEPCTGMGPHRKLWCGWCGHAVVEFQDCNHNNPDTEASCQVRQRREADKS